jgi:2-polyprenyl-3-methyl-5-hydroxy-6-metoxy-1,4-benzoquinol methylase
MNLDIDFSIMREPGFFNRILKERKLDKLEIDKVGVRHIVRCPICSRHNSDNEIFYETEFGNYIKCFTCHCLYLDTIPKEPNTGQYSTQTQKTIEDIPDESKREYRKQRFGEERISIIDRFLSKPLSKSSLLDIGCNTGFFLETAKPYFNEVCGLEKSPSLVVYSAKKTGCRVYCGDISMVDHKFDVITLFDTIEHLESPVSFLKKCSSLLKENGLLFFITPNYKSFGFDMLNSQCNHISPGHLTLFCEDTSDYLTYQLKLKPALYQTCGMDIFDTFAYLRDICYFDLSTHFDNDKMNGLQYKLNKLGYGNSFRSVLVNEVKNGES